MRWSRYLRRKASLFWLFSAFALAGAVMVVFGWNRVTADQAAKTAAIEAEERLAVRLCVANFRANPSADTQLAELRTIAAWARPILIAKGGWDHPADPKKPVPGVAKLCANQLIIDSNGQTDAPVPPSR